MTKPSEGAAGTPRCKALVVNLFFRYPDPLPNDQKLKYYMEAMSAFQDLAHELERELSARDSAAATPNNEAGRDNKAKTDPVEDECFSAPDSSSRRLPNNPAPTSPVAAGDGMPEELSSIAKWRNDTQLSRVYSDELRYITALRAAAAERIEELKAWLDAAVEQKETWRARAESAEFKVGEFKDLLSAAERQLAEAPEKIERMQKLATPAEFTVQENKRLRSELAVARELARFILNALDQYGHTDYSMVEFLEDVRSNATAIRSIPLQSSEGCES